MADNTQQNILLAVQVVDNFINAKKNVDQWKQALDEAQKITTTAKSTIDQLSTGLNQATALFDTAAQAIQGMAGDEDLLGAVTQKAGEIFGGLQQQLTALDGLQLNIGDPQQLQEVIGTLSTLKDQTTAFGESIKNFDSGKPFSSLSAIAESGNALIGTIGTLSQQTGIEIEGFDQFAATAQNVVGVISTVSTITEALSAVKVKSIATNAAQILSEANLRAAKLLGINTTAAQAATEQAATVIKGEGSLASKAAAVAQWLWNEALLANPIVAIIAGVAALTAGIVLLVGALSSSSNEQEKANKAQADYEAQSKKTEATLTSIDQQYEVNSKNMQNRHEAELTSLKKKHASSTEIAQAEARQARESADLLIATSQKKQKTDQDELNATNRNIAAKKNLLNTQRLSSDEAKKEQEALDALIKKRGELTTSIGNEQAARDKANNDAAQKDQAAQQAQEEDRKKAQETRRKNLVKHYQDLQAVDKVNIINSEKYTKDWLDSEIKLIKDEQQQKIVEAQGNKAKIALINAEARKQLSDLNKDYAEHDKKEAEDAAKVLETVQKNILGMLKQTPEQQLKNITDKYDETIKKMNDVQPPKAPEQRKNETDEEFAVRQKQYETDLAKYKEFQDKKKTYEEQLIAKKNEEITALSKKNYDDDLAAGNKAIDEKYQADLLKCKGNEKEKLAIQLQAENDKLSAIKALPVAKNADGTDNQQAINEREKLIQESEERIANLKTSQSNIQLNKDLKDANSNIDKTHKAKQDALQRELEAVKGNADKEAEIKAKMADEDKDYYNKKIDQVKAWADKASEMATQVSSVFKAQGDAEVQKAEDDNNAKKTALESQLNSGLITKKQYDKQVAASEADLAAKKKKIAQEQAIREKSISLFSAIVNTAKAVADALPDVVLAALAGTIGAAQVATIMATPLPKASRGMLLQGRSHAQGGIPIEAEGGEAIINKRSTSMFRPLLSSINEAGGGVRFANGGIIGRVFADGGITNTAFTNDGGYSARAQVNTITAGDMHDAMLSAVSKVKVYTTVEDYRKADVNYTNIVNSGTV